jgi:hypothetical protein
MGCIFFISIFPFLCLENQKENLDAGCHIAVAFVANKYSTDTHNKLGKLFFFEES